MFFLESSLSYATEETPRDTKLIILYEENEAFATFSLMEALDINADFPSKNYSRYRSQSKTNPFLTKLTEDAGYPQEIFFESKSSSSPSKNYLRLNRKNLKNFFADRLPPKDASLERESFTIDASKLFEIKKKQNELKNMTKTKTTLTEKLVANPPNSSSSSVKINHLFMMNDKNEDFKRKFMEENFRTTSDYQTNNYQKGTQSTSKKYTKTPKKEAYTSVFGIENSAISRKEGSSMESSPTRPVTEKTSRNNKKSLVNSSQMKEEERKKLSCLIEKIDQQRQIIDPSNRFGVKPYVVPQNKEANIPIKSEVVLFIKEVSSSYKGKTIDLRNDKKLTQIEDIEKIDKNFYNSMVAHKAKRLGNRETFVRGQSRTLSLVSHSKNSSESKNNSFRHNFDEIKDDISLSSEEEEKYEELQKEEPIYKINRLTNKNSVYHFKKLGRELVDAFLHARFFGFENRLDMYRAFWKNPPPYEKSGSYAFFKAIKHGHLDEVKRFVQIDRDFVYERDHKGRSSFIYAIKRNETEIAQYLLHHNVNVNQKCFTNKNSLYYAIKNNNVNIVKRLLLAGADPWSTKGCELQELLIQTNNTQINNLIKNARKVSMGVKMVTTKKDKVEFWNRVKFKIDETQVIEF